MISLTAIRENKDYKIRTINENNNVKTLSNQLLTIITQNATLFGERLQD